MNQPFDQRKQNLDEWFAKLQHVYTEAGFDAPDDVEHFSEYFDEGMTPEETFEEDMFNE